MRVMSDTEANEADWLVCERTADQPTPPRFDGDLFGHCTVCGEGIHFRPTAPEKPKRVCIQCALAGMAKAKEAGKPINSAVTETTLREVNLYNGPAKGNA